MTVQERVEHGIPGRLPLTWDAARDLFSSEPFVRELLGEELTTKFCSVHKVCGVASLGYIATAYTLRQEIERDAGS